MDIISKRNNVKVENIACPQATMLLHKAHKMCKEFLATCILYFRTLVAKE